MDAEVGDEGTDTELPTGLFKRIDDIENNLGLPSLPEVLDDSGNVIQEEREATYLNAGVELLRSDTDKLEN